MVFDAIGASMTILKDRRINTRTAVPHAIMLDSTAALCHVAAMTVARILELERKTTQSGKANAGLWLLQFERQEPQRPDPLTGWNGSGDTNTQVRINFPTKDAAIAYCDKLGLQYHVVPAPPVRMKIQAYADNFR
jgi:hypothetical protein